MNKKKILAVSLVVLIVIAMFAAYFVFREKPVDGIKNITIEVVNSKNQSTVYTLKTDALYLKQAMDEAKGLTYSGETDSYGFMVTTVNGERAKYAEDGAYWSFYVNGEYCNYGMSEQPVNDGDAFKIAYTPA